MRDIYSLSQRFAVTSVTHVLPAKVAFFVVLHVQLLYLPVFELQSGVLFFFPRRWKQFRASELPAWEKAMKSSESSLIGFTFT
jgi:hypothetical protein